MTLDGDIIGFEATAHSNGDTTWSAREFATFLGYADYASFAKGPLDRAMAASTRAGITVVENFRQGEAVIDGRTVKDMKLSRFGCFLVAMNADAKKAEVARAQVYLAGLADAFQDYVNAQTQVDRVVIRGELTDGETSLASVAKGAGVEKYQFFQSEGYRGMYNMTLRQLRSRKGVPATRSPLDFMHSTELAANLFRITQTRDKIVSDGVTGQMRLEKTAHEVGRTVRKAMIDLGNPLPEDLPAAGDIRTARSSLKQTHRDLNKIDRAKKSTPRQIGPGTSAK